MSWERNTEWFQTEDPGRGRGSFSGFAGGGTDASAARANPKSNAVSNLSSQPERQRQEPLGGTDKALCDKKGRVMIAKKNRERLGDRFAMAISETGCLVAYPRLVWERLNDEIDSYPMINAGRSDYSRLLNGSSEDGLEFDPQGRVVIPASLRTQANIELDTSVLLVGCGNRLEIWPLDEYEKFEQDREGYNKDRRVKFESAYNRMVAKA